MQDGLIVSKRMDIVVGLDAQQGKGNYCPHMLDKAASVLFCLVEALLLTRERDNVESNVERSMACRSASGSMG